MCNWLEFHVDISKLCIRGKLESPILIHEIFVLQSQTRAVTKSLRAGDGYSSFSCLLTKIPHP